jgi:hypothetical protein
VLNSIVEIERQKIEILIKKDKTLYDEKEYIFVLLNKFFKYKDLCDLASEKVIYLAKNIGAIEDDIKVNMILRPHKITNAMNYNITSEEDELSEDELVKK